MNKNLLTDYRSIALLVAAAHVAGILLTSAMVEKFEPPVLSLTMVELADGGAVGDGGEAGGGGGGAKEAEPAAQQPAESKPVKQEAAPVKAKPAAPVEPKPQPVVKKAPEVKPEIKQQEKVAEPVKPIVKQAPKALETPKPVTTPTPVPKTNPAPATSQADYVKSNKTSSTAGSGAGGGGAAGNKNKAGSGQGGDAKGSDKGSGSDSGSGSGGGGDTKANHRGGYLNNPKPKYPELSREMGEEGRVGLTVTVEPNGSPSSVSVSRSSGYPRLDKAAERAVRGYRFKPATRGGTPIRSTYTFSIDFRLDS